MEPTMIVILCLSFALAIVFLVAMNERRHRNTLKSLLHRVLQPFGEQGGAGHDSDQNRDR